MPRLVKSELELAQSVRRFMRSPEYWRDVIGNNPMYFVHLDADGVPFWGLSKFCAFHKISVLNYVTKIRRTIGGGATQKHISGICEKEWTPLADVTPKLREQFNQWFSGVTGGRLQTTNIHLMTIDGKNTQRALRRRKRVVSPEELRRRLAEQAETGEIGEEIAVQYEIDRLRSLGARDPNVEHVSRLNSAAGFDIRSAYKRNTRYIEVKASVNREGDIYVTLNEVLTLQKHGKDAYIYFVFVSDKKARIGRVVMELRNPFANGKETSWIRPVLFQGVLPGVKTEA